MTRIQYFTVLGAALFAIFAACGDGSAAETAQVASNSSVAPTTSAAPTTTSSAPPTTTPPTTSQATTTTGVPPTTTVIVDEVDCTEAVDLEEVTKEGRVKAGWLVEPGLYRSDILARPLQLCITEPVAYLNVIDDAITFGAENVSFDQLDVVVLTEFVGVISASDVGNHPPHTPVIPVGTQEMPDDIGDWFAAVPQLVVVQTGETVAAGAPAAFWDIEVDSSAGDTFECQFGQCVATYVASTGPFVMGDRALFRIWQLSGDGEGVYAFVQGVPSKFEQTVALGQMILDGLVFEVTD